jgi:hypothetical protein
MEKQQQIFSKKKEAATTEGSKAEQQGSAVA